MILPPVGSSRPAIRLRTVLLPQPLGPMTERNSPSGTERLSPDRAVTSALPEPYVLLIPSRRTTALTKRSFPGRTRLQLSAAPRTYQVETGSLHCIDLPSPVGDAACMLYVLTGDAAMPERAGVMPEPSRPPSRDAPMQGTRPAW